MPSDFKKSDIGGYAAASEPVTRKPRSASIPASDAMAVPQMPMRWMCLFEVIRCVVFSVNSELLRSPGFRASRRIDSRPTELSRQLAAKCFLAKHARCEPRMQPELPDRQPRASQLLPAYNARRGFGRSSAFRQK